MNAGIAPDGRWYGYPAAIDANGTVWLADVDGKLYFEDGIGRCGYQTVDGRWLVLDPAVGRRPTDLLAAPDRPAVMTSPTATTTGTSESAPMSQP